MAEGEVGVHVEEEEVTVEVLCAAKEMENTRRLMLRRN